MKPAIGATLRPFGSFRHPAQYAQAVEIQIRLGGAKRVLALQVESCSPRLIRLARQRALVAFGLSAGVLAAGPVQPVYSSAGGEPNGPAS